MSAISLRAEDLAERVRFERKVAAGGFTSAGKDVWEAFDTVWAGVQDVLPSRGERTADGLPVATRRTRVRIRWRDDITGDMRIVHGDRIMEIVSGPVVLGRRGGLEMIAEDYSTSGSKQP